METNSKRNEHPACGCRMCRLGAGTETGQLEHRRTNRRVRHNTKRALRAIDPEDFDPVIEGTGYTD